MAQRPLTEEQMQEAVDALEKYGNKQAAADALNIPRGTFANRIRQAQRNGINTLSQKREVMQGWSPENDLSTPIPSPLIIRGTSSLYKDGELKLQWVKTKLSDAKVEEAIKAAVKALAEGIKPCDPVSAPSMTLAHLCNLYTLTDCHVGMKAWGAETGADWDLDIAERTLKGAFNYLVTASPKAKTCIVNNLGDLLHFDSLNAVTPTNNHLLDADSRYSKVVKVAVRILRHIIDLSLVHHEKVIVMMNEGNHDPASSVWLRHLFGLLYENEPRVHVVDVELPYVVYEHGNTLLAFHHGHMSKKESLPLLFAASYPKEWGNTTRRYCHVGHQHHVDEKEYSGMKVKQHATLAARDAYAARGGWIADRQIEAITYHTEYGQVGTITCVPDMLD